MDIMKTQSIQSRLAAKRAGKYVSPFTISYLSRWGGEPFKVAENVGYHSTFGRWHESPEVFARFTGLAQEIIKLRFTGWYTDSDGCNGELARGVVYSLSHGRFIAGVADPVNADKNGQGPCIFEVDAKGNPCLYDDKEDAARAADSLAEIYAEGAREEARLFDARQKAEIDAEDAKSDLESLRSDARSLLADIRESKLSSGLCDRLTREFKRMRYRMHAAFHELQEANAKLAELPSF